MKSRWRHSATWASAVGDFWGAEERSPEVGAPSALASHFGRGCLIAAPTGRVVSSAARPLGEYRRSVDAFSVRRPSMSLRRAPPAATCTCPGCGAVPAEFHTFAINHPESMNTTVKYQAPSN
jgi:hypothetical protein